MFTPTPVIDAISPASGRDTGGTLVFVTGSGLATATSVKFGGVNGSIATIPGDTLLEVSSPAGTAGTSVDVTVTSPGGTSQAVTADRFAYTSPPQPGAPVVRAVSPDSGFPPEDGAVFISGSGFTGTTAVAFGSTSVACCAMGNASRRTSSTRPSASRVRLRASLAQLVQSWDALSAAALYASTA